MACMLGMFVKIVMFIAACVPGNVSDHGRWHDYLGMFLNIAI